MVERQESGNSVVVYQRPTLPGKVEGIIGMNPLQLQCRDCGRIYTGSLRHTGADVILSGFHFHRCEGRAGVRRCPSCLAAVKAACPKGH